MSDTPGQGFDLPKLPELFCRLCTHCPSRSESGWDSKMHQ